MLIFLGFVIPIHLIFLAGFWLILRGKVYEFDHANRYASFQMVYTAYRGAFWAIFTTALPSAFYLADIHLGGPATLLFAAALDALLFNLALTYFYESYLHVRYLISPEARSNYTASKYALVLTLGFSAVVCYCVGALGAFAQVSGW